MKVSEYHKQGLKHFTEEKPADYKSIGSAKEGVHRIEFFIKEENGIIKDAKFTASKRCKKLLAVADLTAEMLKGQPADKYSIDREKILQFFKEEKEKGKMENRLSIVTKALGIE
ncbi:nicotinate phosphoribosyltransferase [Persephonella sp.]